MDEQFFAGRLLENENLTDNLEDTDANTLLNWAVGQIGGIITNPLTAGDRVNGLMAVLRKINHLVPDLANKPPQEIAAELADLAKMVGGAFERTPPVGAMDLQNLAGALKTASTSEAIQTLLEWISKE